MYFDITYLIIVLPAVLLATLASANVNSTVHKYSKVISQRRMSGRDAARRILDANGLHHIRIEHISGNLTDHYDPKAGVIRLSDAVYSKLMQKAIDAIVEQYRTKVVDPQNQRIGITHGDCLEEAELLAKRVCEIAQPKEIIIVPHEPFTGAHVGPGMLALFFFGEERK